MPAKKAVVATKPKVGKAKGKAKVESKTLEKPKVSDAEIADAQRMLEDKDAKRRANSNMMYYLAARQERNAYDQCTPAERKEFAVAWAAWSMKDSEVKHVTNRRMNTQTKEKSVAKWYSKHKLNEMFGAEKAKAKIDKLDNDPKRHRPDRDTGLDTEDHREYMIFDDETQTNSIEDLEHTLASTKDITSDQAKAEAEEDIAALCNRGAIGVGHPARAAASDEPKIKVEGARPSEDMKTFDAIKSKPKQVLRNLGDAVTELKRMFEMCSDPKRKKYTEPLMNDITKLLPKLKTDFTNLEKIHTRSATDTPVPDGEVLATARKIDKNYEEVAQITEWFARMVPKTKKSE